MEKSMSLWNTLVPGRRLCWIIGMLQAFRRMLREAWKESVKLFLFVLKWLCFLLDYFLWPFRVLPSLYFSLNLLTIFKIVQRHLVCIIHAEPLLPKLLTHLLLTWSFPIKPCNVTVLSAPVHPSLPVSGSSRESMNLCIGKAFCSVLLYVSMHLSVSEWVSVAMQRTHCLYGGQRSTTNARHCFPSCLKHNPSIIFAVLQATPQASEGSPILCLPSCFGSSGIGDSFYHCHLYTGSRDSNLGLCLCSSSFAHLIITRPLISHSQGNLRVRTKDFCL